MLAKITLYDGTVYKIASQTVDTEDGIYLGRIKDELSLVSAMQEAGNAPETISLTIINYDNFIPHNKDLWAAEVLLTSDSGISWRGKINFCNFDSDGNLYVTASEKTAPELELQMPDEVRQVYTVDEDFHQSSVTMTIPLVIGGTTSNPITLPTILIDKTRGIYLICVGEIRRIVRVLNGAEPLPSSAYTAYTGTADQEENAGFAYVQINEDYRLNSDGSYAEINVEVVGLKLGDFTEEECRNGALFLYYFLTTADTGINGWGCGIDTDLIDTDSFQSAITLCNQLGYKLDGIMWLRQSAQSWIDQICQAIHGKYSINANGKRSLFIDYAGNASKKTFTASNMRVDRYGKNSYTSVVYNKGVLSYDYNPITGLFMQSAQYENAESIAQIGEQKFVGESYMLKDPTTALAVLEYTCKRSQTAAEAIEFETDDIETNLRAGDVITINRPDININNILYQIQNISITDYEASISAVKFDTSVFIVSGTPSSVNWGSEKSITPALTPAQATNLLLSTGFDINPDGTGTPYISGSFTVPDGGWLAAAVQYGIGTNPSNWTELALITDGKFKISPVNVGTVYSVRVRMITATGHSSYITGQITATGDSTPPLAPTIAVKATDKTITVQCGLDSPPYDLGGFQIFRKKSTEADSAYTFIGNVASNRGLDGTSQPLGYATFTDYVSEYVTYNYKAKSYDRSGNLSLSFSNVASITVTGIAANDVAATALAMPTGSILRLSAKNCTTASIAEANGVKDVSGRGNHGQAVGGVEIVKDKEMGDCYSFDGTDDRLKFTNSNLLSTINNSSELTFVFRIKTSSTSGRVFSLNNSTSSAGNQLGCFQIEHNLMVFYDRLTSSGTQKSLSCDFDSDNHFVAVTVNYSEGKSSLYLDANLVDNSENWLTGNKSGVLALWIGSQGNSYFANGLISDVRIYPRALSASEVKTLYMFPDDVTFGQMTADLIGANVIKASNLVLTENIITQTAQIKDAIITNAKISDLNASKINAGTLDASRIAANAITAEKLNIEAIKAPDGAYCVYCAKNCQELSGNVTSGISDSSGYGNSLNSLSVTTYLDSEKGRTFNFDGSSGYAYKALTKQIPSSSELSIHFDMWVSSSVSSTKYMILLVGSSFQFNIAHDSNGYLLIEGYGNSYTSSSKACTGKWLTIDIVFRSDGKRDIYYNGSAAWLDRVSGATTHPIITTVYLGAANPKFNGKLNNIRIYNRALTAAEVKTLYMLGTDTESGQITADRIATDAIKSRNYAAGPDSTYPFASIGTFIDTANGNIYNKSFFSTTDKGAAFKDGDRILAINKNYGLDYFETSSSIANNSGGLAIETTGNYGIDIKSGAKIRGIRCGKGIESHGYNVSAFYGDTNSGSFCIQAINNGTGDAIYGLSSGGIGGVFSTESSTAYALQVNGKAYCTSGTWTACDESIKRDIKDVSTLEKLKDIRVKKFKYSEKIIKTRAWIERKKKEIKDGIPLEDRAVMPVYEDDENSPEYIMAMAGEFNKTFGIDNNNEESINYTNAIGVALRAIQELAEIVDSQKAEIAELKDLLKSEKNNKESNYYGVETTLLNNQQEEQK